jgi:transposase-like protein
MEENPIWRTDCPSCKIGNIFLTQKGGIGRCDSCKRRFYTDYCEHTELETQQTEYWVMEEVYDKNKDKEN